MSSRLRPMKSRRTAAPWCIAAAGAGVAIGTIASKATFVSLRSRHFALAAGQAGVASLPLAFSPSPSSRCVPKVVAGAVLAASTCAAVAVVARRSWGHSAISARARQVACGARGCKPGGTIETFLLQGSMDAGKLAAACAPLAMHIDLDAVVFFTLGVAPELISSVAGGALGLHGSCPVYVVDCYGIIGWDKVKKQNMELMEKGRGSEYGCQGGNGGEGVVVAAFRGGAFTPTCFEKGVGASLPGQCTAHMVMKGGPGAPEAPAAGAVFGGVAKRCFALKHSGDLEEVAQVAVSSNAAVVSSFIGEARTATGAILEAAGTENKAYSALGYFPCFCRGVNKYGEDDVEVKEFAAAGLEGVPIFGMFAHGEIGPPVGGPIQCTPETDALSSVEVHSMTSVVALYST